MMGDRRSDVVVLGSGQSIGTLTEAERDFINGCEVRIALNKFFAFRDVAGITPTHVFFLDAFEDSCRYWLQYVFSTAIRDDVVDLTFVLSKGNQGRLHVCTSEERNALRSGGYFDALDADPMAWKPFLKGEIRDVDFLAPSNSQFQFVEHGDWLAGGQWATSLEEPLYHHRGSLTSLLNYIAIAFPGRPTRLVGTDFGGSAYFFEDAMSRIRFEKEDWTTPIVQQQSKHFSAIEYEGSTMFDRFLLVQDKLLSAGNRLSTNNPESLLVSECRVPVEPLSDASTAGADHPAETFSASELWSRCSASLESLGRTHAELQRCRAELREAEWSVDHARELENSLSYRIGRAITYPIRALANRSR